MAEDAQLGGAELGRKLTYCAGHRCPVSSSERYTVTILFCARSGTTYWTTGASRVPQMVKNMSAMQETWVQYLGWEDPLEKWHSNPLQYSCLENPMDRGAWWATVHRTAKSQTRLKTHTCIHALTVQDLSYKAQARVSLTLTSSL